MSTSPAITIGELEAKYPLYCKAMRLLLSEGRSPLQMKKTLCWERLETLHMSLPRRYKAPFAFVTSVSERFGRLKNLYKEKWEDVALLLEI